MVVFPNAKINLGLNITEKRKDGYHNLITCFYPVRWRDALEIIEAPKLKFSSSGIAIPGKEEDNLCIKAFKLLQKDFGLSPVAIHLHKAIPVGAGLGGGSSDASFTLKALNELFKLFLDPGILELYAGQLGSDCPFFIENNPVLATGTGNIFTPVKLDLSGNYIVIIFPEIHISTAEAFSEIKPAPSKIDIKDVFENQSVEKWKEFLINDFEEGIFDKYPSILEIKKFLYSEGALFASMSGSGAAVFGIFKNKPALEENFMKRYTCWEGNL